MCYLYREVVRPLENDQTRLVSGRPIIMPMLIVHCVVVSLFPNGALSMSALGVIPLLNVTKLVSHSCYAMLGQAMYKK